MYFSVWGLFHWKWSVDLNFLFVNILSHPAERKEIKRRPILEKATSSKKRNTRLYWISLYYTKHTVGKCEGKGRTLWKLWLIYYIWYFQRIQDIRIYCDLYSQLIFVKGIDLKISSSLDLDSHRSLYPVIYKNLYIFVFKFRDIRFSFKICNNNRINLLLFPLGIVDRSVVFAKRIYFSRFEWTVWSKDLYQDISVLQGLIKGIIYGFTWGGGVLLKLDPLIV